MKLRVLPDEKFTCSACGNCCHGWHVELTDAEVANLPTLAWPESDPLRTVRPHFTHAGRHFLSKRPDGYCVYYNDANHLCRIHEQFGPGPKPLGCKRSKLTQDRFWDTEP